MAPVDQNMKSKKFTTKGGSWKKPKTNTQGVQKKGKWIPDGKVFQGSVKEGKSLLITQ